MRKYEYLYYINRKSLCSTVYTVLKIFLAFLYLLFLQTVDKSAIMSIDKLLTQEYYGGMNKQLSKGEQRWT